MGLCLWGARSDLNPIQRLSLWTLLGVGIAARDFVIGDADVGATLSDLPALRGYGIRGSSWVGLPQPAVLLSAGA